MLPPIALQLYTVREVLAQDFTGTIHRIAEIGFVGVEPAGLTGKTVHEAADLFKTLGLEVPSVHCALPIGDQKNEVLDIAAALDCKQLIIAYLPAEQFKSADQIKATCERLNEANSIAQQNGLTLGYHNHWWEFEPMADGRTPHELMRAYLTPTIIFELDIYWIKTGGSDPIKVIQTIGTRAPLLHVKDGPVNPPSAPMVAVGDGSLDIPSILKAGQESAQWLIVELDRCATDMLEAVAKSYRYLIAQELGHGRKS